MNQKVVDQRVIAIYFDKNRQVKRGFANYGLQDGKIFDFVGVLPPPGPGAQLPDAPVRSLLV